MTTGYYLEDHPNLNLAQFGWLRVRIWESGQHLSGVIGVHTSEAITDFEGVDNNAENNAAFIVRRTNHGSYTTSADADSILPLVHPRWAAWADIMNNVHAMSVAGCLQAARWREMAPERAAAVVRNMAIAAAIMVQTAVADGYLAAPTPAVRITAAEAISGSRPGFYGHGETNPGTRYDPGAHFDWDLFLSTYAAAIGGGINYQSGTTSEEDFMGGLIDAEQAEAIAERAATLVFEKLDNRLRINAVQAESIVQATTERTAATVDANASGKQIDRQQADDIARAAAQYNQEHDAALYSKESK